MVPFYVGYLLTMGRASHQRIEAMIGARFTNADLATALASARDEALRKRYEAETANASKTAFLANMSHELRTPLNAILGFSDIIAHQAMGRDQIDRYSDYAGDIHNSGVHLLSLINDLLDIAKIESGKMEIDPRADRSAFSDRRRPPPDGAARRRPRPDLTVEIADDVAAGHGRRARPQTDAAQSSFQCGQIHAGGRPSSISAAAPRRMAALQICVSDTGPGIPPEKLERVFEPFSQIDNRFDREAGGTGLGLALVRGVARLHGGKAWLQSAPGKGVRAYLYFPSTMRR